MKEKIIKTVELLLLLIIVSVCVFSVFGSKILDNKVNIILFLIIPFLSLFLIEVMKISKELKIKEQNKLKEFEEINDNIILDKIIETTTKEESKKIKEDLTIKIPIEDIKTQIESINNELSKEDNDLDKTEVLFTQDEIKEIIEKELKSTITVDKSKKNSKKSTDSVEN